QKVFVRYITLTETESTPENVRFLMKFLLLGLLLLGSGSAYAQFAVGLKGGLPLTDFLHGASNPSATFPSRSDRFIVGPTVEVTLPFGFGVELDALYRRFDYRAVESILGTPV